MSTNSDLKSLLSMSNTSLPLTINHQPLTVNQRFTIFGTDTLVMKVSKRLIFFLLGSILGISFSFYAYQIVYTPNILVEKDDRLFIVKQDASFKDVQRELHDGEYLQ